MKPLHAVALILALACGAGPALAQPPTSSIEAVPVQGLSFGSLLPGVPEVVAVSDAGRRAEVVLNGRGIFDLTLLVPDALVSRSGARIPLRFGTRDAAVIRNTAAALMPFNPRQTNRVNIQGNQGPARLVLGGTALPGADQAAGQYTATVVLVVNNPGT